MRRRSDRKPRIYGPYEHRDQWRVHVVTLDSGGRRKTSYFTYPSRAAAEAFITGAREQAQGLTVEHAVKEFLEAKRLKGRAAKTIESAEDRLALMLFGCTTRPVRYLSGRGAELYARAQVYPAGHRRAGQPRAADTHQNALAVARDFGRFCVKRKWLSANPFADVESVGAKVLGTDKDSHTFDESRKLYVWCLESWRKGGVINPDAVLTCSYVLLGARASEMVKRIVRDLDDGGRLLRIGKTKTKAGRRGLEVPDELSEMLQAMAEGRDPEALLFTHPDGSPWSRFVAYGRVKACCKAAGVRVLPPQALRRTWSSVATGTAAAGIEVARQLGHSVGQAPAVTGRAYVDREAAANARVDRVFRVIAGGRR